MSIDQYSICPCGSGKKIKFCKCKDSIHEMERALKMISGGQMVAALDRLNQILEEHPNAAWCLAVKGRLLLELQEDEALAENAERFMRLQPSNPLALTQQAAARGMQGDAQAAAESLLNALAESPAGVDTFVLDVASVLSLLCTQQGNLLTARCFGGLALSAKGYENNAMASSTLEEVNRSREVSTLLKTVPTPDGESTKPDVRERYEEAAGLLKANQILLAETKFQSLARQHSDDEAVLRGLLVCAVWRGDAAAQSDLLRKLSEMESLDFETRARDLAISMLIEPEQPKISTPAYNISWDVDDVDLLQQELIAHERAIQLPDDIVRAAGSRDEHDVPPKTAFQYVDRPIPQGESLPSIEDAPIVTATALVFGKQTDRAARVELVAVCDSDRADAVKFFQSFSAITSEPSSEEMQVPLMSAATPNMPIMRVSGSQAEANALQNALIQRDFARRVLSTPLKMFGGKSADEIMGDDAFKVHRTALVRVVESYDAMSDAPEAIAALREQLDVSQLPEITITEEEQLYSTPLDALDRINVDALAENHLFVLMQRAQVFNRSVVLQATAKRIIDLDMPKDRINDKLVAYMHLVDATHDIESCLEVIDQAKAWATENDVSQAPLLLAEIGRRLASGDAEGFQRTLQQITTDFGDDPQVMTRLQQMLVNYGLINPDGSPRSPAGAPAPASLPSEPAAAAGPGGGEIWTPDSPSAPQPASGGAAESKIWLPGSD